MPIMHFEEGWFPLFGGGNEGISFIRFEDPDGGRKYPLGCLAALHFFSMLGLGEPMSLSYAPLYERKRPF